MHTKKTKQYPLQIAISSLFVIVIIVLGSILTLQNYKQTSNIILKQAGDAYQRISNELALDIKVNYRPILNSIQLLSLSPLNSSNNLDERLQHLKLLKVALTSHPDALYVLFGYQNGELFGAALINTEILKKTYNTPLNTALVALAINRSDAQKAKLVYIFFDEQLNEISRRIEITQFDPRQRPWFKQAAEIPQTTKPYTLHGTGLVGFAAMQKSAPGTIISTVVTLNNLSQTISKHKITPRSEVVLINADGETFAYSNTDQALTEQKAINSSEQSLKLVKMNKLGSDVLSFVKKTLLVKEQPLDFEFHNERWIGSMRVVGKLGGEKIYALMLSPVNELLVDVLSIQQRSLIITLMILLLILPFIMWISKKISSPLYALSLEAQKISRFEFDESDTERSFIKEVDELDSAMDMMKSTINKFIKLINSLAGEKDLDNLLKSITKETMLNARSDAALIYLLDEKNDYLSAEFLCRKEGDSLTPEALLNLSIEEVKFLLKNSGKEDSRIVRLTKKSQNTLAELLNVLDQSELTVIILPLNNRDNDIVGLLCLIYSQLDHSVVIANKKNIDFVEALSGFAAVTLESRQLLKSQEALLNAFIKLIAGAIDAKSPYTGGHCQRVPEITLMLAKAACESNDDKYKNFNLTEQQWEELNIAGWLHDCGKVTTPEFVVDKSTKLETIYDRIHEVRMRFEVLKRDADIAYWQQISDGGDTVVLAAERDKIKQQLDNDFAFLAECNIGGEFMADEKLQRLNQIAQYTWLRTIDDSLGLSWEENNRKQSTTETTLPVEENILADKAEHLIARQEADKIQPDNSWHFKVDTPRYKYNRGELYNLSVKRGTLNDEERYMINGHMIQTIMMLDNLPFPKHLRDVPLIAGSHHETMDGRGYPKRLLMTEQPLTARMMVIADIFEALTASDRPYKKAKTLNESIRILSFFKKDKHIDPDLFDLFLTSGTYLEYANKYLNPEQIDEVDINQYMAD